MVFRNSIGKIKIKFVIMKNKIKIIGLVKKVNINV